MSLKSFAVEAKDALKKVQSLQGKSIKDIQRSHWQKKLQTKPSEKSELESLGTTKLSGEITAAVHITKTADPPLNLAAFEGDTDETSEAYASFVISAQGSAGFESTQAVTAGRFGAGADAGASIALAHHRGHRQSKRAAKALVDLASDLTVPWDVDRVSAIGAHDILQAEFSGRAVVRAFAGWQYGLVQEIKGSKLGDFAPDETLSVTAGAKLGVTFNAGLEGELRVLVEPGQTTSDGRRLIRVKLHKRRHAFAGAGLKLEAGLDPGENVDAFIDSILNQMLDFPDGLVDELRDAQSEIKALKTKLDGLAAGARTDIATAAGKAETKLQLGDVQKLLEKFDEQSPAVQAVLKTFKGRIDSLLARFDDQQEDLEKAVDKLSTSAKGSLDTASNKIGGWISAYEDLRQRSRDHVVHRAKQGIKMEFEAGINRTRSREALLDLEFDTHVARDAYLAAVKGNFGPALEKAPPKNGSTGI
jgi:hypothetical protein